MRTWTRSTLLAAQATDDAVETRAVGLAEGLPMDDDPLASGALNLEPFDTIAAQIADRGHLARTRCTEPLPMPSCCAMAPMLRP
jgi:hypothetical protein